VIPEQPEEPQQTRILVVEDDTLQQAVLASALSARGYEVEIASNGLEAIRIVRERGCDMMLVDYRMPELDGLATAKLVRDLMGEVACPAIIALTVSPQSLLDRKGMLGGAFDGIVAKPIRLTDLLSAIQCCVNAAPNRATRRAAEAALLEKNWAAYDEAPVRRSGSNGLTTSPWILVVEDDDLQQNLLRSVLESRGYVVETACDGIQALRMIREGGYDLVLIDYQLPEIDGLATARLILDLMNDIVRPRMIALTVASGRLDEMQMKTGSAFDEIVEKSSNLSALLAVVDRQLRSAPNPTTRRAAEAMSSPIPKG
jgi:two-component system sensor histidine kinase/response regulator